MTEFAIADAELVDIPPRLLYEVLALRVDVFVVEQVCPYRELDGRDLEPGTRLLWAQRNGSVVATLRILDEGGGVVRIGRVATAAEARGNGLGAELVTRAIALAGDRKVVLAAQAHLADWYCQFGFVRDGDDYPEDGIVHTPMRLSNVGSA
jgi:ElaA protein